MDSKYIEGAIWRSKEGKEKILTNKNHKYSPHFIFLDEDYFGNSYPGNGHETAKSICSRFETLGWVFVKHPNHGQLELFDG